MRRARRATVRRGLSGRQRRRLQRRLRGIQEGRGRGCYGTDDEREARRLHEAGLAVAVVSRSGVCGRRELTLFATRTEALQRHPVWCIMRHR